MFTDAHIHIALNHRFTAKDWIEANDDKRVQFIREIFADYKKLRITALRDGGDNAFISFKAREVARTEGINYKSPVYALYKKGCYGSFVGKPVSDLDEIKKELIELSLYKPDHIKVMLTGLVNFEKYGDVGGTNFTLRELSYIAEFAKERKLPVMVHANGREGVDLAVKAGISTLEHGYLISDAELHRMAEAGVIWVPTLSPLGNILKTADSKYNNAKDVIRKVFYEQVENIKIAAAIGVKLSLGSDAGAYLVGHGSGLLDEMEHFANIGCFSRREIESMCERSLVDLFQ